MVLALLCGNVAQKMQPSAKKPAKRRHPGMCCCENEPYSGFPKVTFSSFSHRTCALALGRVGLCIAHGVRVPPRAILHAQLQLRQAIDFGYARGVENVPKV